MGIIANRGSATQVVDLKSRTAIPRLNGLRVHLILGGSEFQHGAERSSPLRMLRVRAVMKRRECYFNSNFGLPVLILHFPKVMNRGFWKPQLLHRRFLREACSLALLDGSQLA